jgi:DNA-binding NarL/FixJ family response regulator
MRTANEVGSAIVHQLNGPLTALRLYLGEIRQHSDQLPGASAGAGGAMQKIVESAFQEIERVCAMIRMISDTFETSLHPETAAAHGRDVISGWLRSSGTEGGCDDASGPGQASSAESIHSLLTPREREVLGHVSRGCSNKQGAIRMQIAPRTVDSHRAQLMRKFGAKNGVDLVRMALDENPVRS